MLPRDSTTRLPRELLEMAAKAPAATAMQFTWPTPPYYEFIEDEAPGAEEDLQGLPFVGAAGQLLNNLLSKLGLSRDEVYITNVVKSRPPENRDPLPEEVAACLPFLEKQIEAVRPRVIVTLGRIAAHALLRTKAPMTQLRGKWQKYGKILVMPTFHPSYLLRFPKERHKTWADMQQVLEYLASQEEN